MNRGALMRFHVALPWSCFFSFSFPVAEPEFGHLFSEIEEYRFHVSQNTMFFTFTYVCWFDFYFYYSLFSGCVYLLRPCVWIDFRFFFQEMMFLLLEIKWKYNKNTLWALNTEHRKKNMLIRNGIRLLCSLVCSQLWKLWESDYMHTCIVHLCGIFNLHLLYIWCLLCTCVCNPGIVLPGLKMKLSWKTDLKDRRNCRQVCGKWLSARNLEGPFSCSKGFTIFMTIITTYCHISVLHPCATKSFIFSHENF